MDTPINIESPILKENIENLPMLVSHPQFAFLAFLGFCSCWFQQQWLASSPILQPKKYHEIHKKLSIYLTLLLN